MKVEYLVCSGTCVMCRDRTGFSVCDVNARRSSLLLLALNTASPIFDTLFPSGVTQPKTRYPWSKITFADPKDFGLLKYLKKVGGTSEVCNLKGLSNLANKN